MGRRELAEAVLDRLLAAADPDLVNLAAIPKDGILVLFMGTPVFESKARLLANHAGDDDRGFVDAVHAASLPRRSGPSAWTFAAVVDVGTVPHRSVFVLERTFSIVTSAGDA